MVSRRKFFKQLLLTGAASLTAPILSRGEILSSHQPKAVPAFENGGLIVPKNNGLRITGTFLDEISHDIPHQNWGRKNGIRIFRI